MRQAAAVRRCHVRQAVSRIVVEQAVAVREEALLPKE
jgi:hypothetical protein